MSDFAREACRMAEALFDPDEVETRVRRLTGADISSAVMVVHTPTDERAACDQWQTQLMNKTIALLELRRKLDSEDS